MLLLYLLFVYFWTEEYVFFKKKKKFKELKGFSSFDKQLSYQKIMQFLKLKQKSSPFKKKNLFFLFEYLLFSNNKTKLFLIQLAPGLAMVIVKRCGSLGWWQ